MEVSGTTITVVVAFAVLVPRLVQVVKLRFREMADTMPPGAARDRVMWWSKGWGPVIANLLLWLAGVAVALIPVISDGDLTLLEIIGIAGGTTVTGAMVSGGLHGIEKAARKSFPPGT